jgi:SagB-type dehydrogenase family enzyme
MRPKQRMLIPVLAALTALTGAVHSPHGQAAGPGRMPAADASVVPLPRPRLTGTISVEAALTARRSIRSFSDGALGMDELSQLLWAGQGITLGRGLRTAPSAGALYPLVLYVAAGNVASLPAGIYRYEPAGHRLVAVVGGDKRSELAEAARGQSAVRTAAIVIAVMADYQRTTVKYGERGVRYVHLEAGHAAQNIALQATALGLGTVMIGAFSDVAVSALLKVSGKQPLYLIPVGRK